MLNSQGSKVIAGKMPLAQILLLSKEEYPSEAQGEVVCPFQELVQNSLREERSKRNSKGRWLEP